jgi:FkbM family methyltransferase
MKNGLKIFLKKIVFIFIPKKSREIISIKNPITVLKFLLSSRNANHKKLLPLILKSKSQNYQDIFVLSELNMKQEGFFVEFGATNGIDLSNTFLLEEEFDWKGILAEPALFWHKALRENRPSAFIEDLCVWTKSNIQVMFNETENTELSTMEIFSNLDSHHELRKIGQKYFVETISLTDLLDKYSAPKHIDYLSIDTEGSEIDILNAFDFERYSFGVITCEHNYTTAREKIYKLLTSKGYIRKSENISRWDDWYVKV